MADKQTKLTKSEQEHLAKNFPGGAYKYSGGKGVVIGTSKPLGVWKPKK